MLQLASRLLLRWTLFIRAAAAFVFSRIATKGFHACGKRALFRLPCTIYKAKNISLGSVCYFGPHSWLQATPATPEVKAPIIKIGSHFSATSHLHISAVLSVTIEDKVLIARFVHISDHSHQTGDLDRPIVDQGRTTPKPVLIKTGAWIGQGVVICPGVTIGRNCVIGANSVVTRDIPDFTVAAGAPARVVKHLVSPK